MKEKISLTVDEFDSYVDQIIDSTVEQRRGRDTGVSIGFMLITATIGLLIRDKLFGYDEDV